MGIAGIGAYRSLNYPARCRRRRRASPVAGQAQRPLIVGVGVDIVDIQRIEATLQRSGERFVQRILAPDEQQEYTQHPHPGRFLAKRWALKEAASKALGTGIAVGVGFHDFRLHHSELGQPLLAVQGAARERALYLCTPECFDFQVSLSDEQQWVIAYVVLSKVSSKFL